MTVTVENIEAKVIADCGGAVLCSQGLTGWFETIPYDCDISMKAEKCSCTKYVQSMYKVVQSV